MSDEGQEQGSGKERRQRGPDKAGRKRRRYEAPLAFTPTWYSYLDRLMVATGSKEGLVALEEYARTRGAICQWNDDGTLTLLMTAESYAAKCIWRQSGRLRRHGLEVHACTSTDSTHIPTSMVLERRH